MNPIKNKKDLDATIDEIRNFAYSYLDKEIVKTNEKFEVEIKNGSKHKIYWEAELLVKDEFGYIIKRKNHGDSGPMAITLEPNRLYNTNTLHLWWDGNDDLIEQKNFYYNWDLTNDPVTDLVIEDITLRTIQLIKVD